MGLFSLCVFVLSQMTGPSFGSSGWRTYPLQFEPSRGWCVPGGLENLWREHRHHLAWSHTVTFGLCSAHPTVLTMLLGGAWGSAV